MTRQDMKIAVNKWLTKYDSDEEIDSIAEAKINEEARKEYDEIIAQYGQAATVYAQQRFDKRKSAEERQQ